MNNTKRKELKVQGDESQEIMIKLWDQHSEEQITNGQNVVIFNLRTTSFRGIRSLNSNDETFIEVRYFYFIQLFKIGILQQGATK